MGKAKLKKKTLIRKKDKKTQPLLSDPAQDPNFRPMFAPCGDALATTSLVSSQRPETPIVKSAAVSNLLRGLRKLPNIPQGKLEESLPEPEVLRRDEEHEDTQMGILADVQILTESTEKPNFSFHNSTPVKITNPGFPNHECSAIERPETPEDTVACFEERNAHVLETASGDSSFSSITDVSAVSLPEQFPDPPEFTEPYLNPTIPFSSAWQSKEHFPPLSDILIGSTQSQSSIPEKKPTVKEKQHQATSRNFNLEKDNINDAETGQTSANQASSLHQQKSKEQIPPNSGVLITTDPTKFQPPSLEEKQTRNNTQRQCTSVTFDLASLNTSDSKGKKLSPKAAKESASKLNSSYKGVRFNPFKKGGASKPKQMPKKTAVASASEMGPGRWRENLTTRKEDLKQYQLEMERSPVREPLISFVKKPKSSHTWTFGEGVRYQEAVDKTNTVVINRPPNFNFESPVKPFVKKFKLQEDTP